MINNAHKNNAHDRYSLRFLYNDTSTRLQSNTESYMQVTELLCCSTCSTFVTQELAQKPYELLDFSTPEGTVCFLTGSSTSYSLRGVGAKGGQYWYSFVSALSSNSMPASAISSLSAASFSRTTSALGVGYPLEYQQGACQVTLNAVTKASEYSLRRGGSARRPEIGAVL